MPPRHKNVANTTKFGNRKITSINSTDTIKLQAIDVSTINGVSVKEDERLQIKQTSDIENNRQDVLLLQSKVEVLENYVSELRQIIYTLVGKNNV